MDKKHKHHKAGKTPIPAADSFTNHDNSGWMSRLYHDGWLKKRWRKRYCVLSNGTLYVYEKQTSKGTETTSVAIDLTKFSSCVKATGKESKKSPNTIMLEPTVSNNATGEKEQNNNVAREYFFTDDAVDIDKWMAKLKESLSLSCTGAKAKLEHVTKSRARPPKGGSGNRRPPTKHHIKERARMSEIVLDEEPEAPRKSARESRGHLPATAMKPTGKPILPNPSRNLEKTANEKNMPVIEESDAMNNLQEPSENDKADSPQKKPPPKLPPAALKPKPKATDDSPPSKSAESDSEGSEEELDDESEPVEVDTSAKQSTFDDSEISESKTISPPKLPPAAMKPKFRPSVTDIENRDEDDLVDVADSKTLAVDSETSVAAQSLPCTTESSPKQNEPPALPPIALKPKMTPEKSAPPTDEEMETEDSANVNEETTLSSSNSDSNDDITSNYEDTDNGKPDVTLSKSLSNLNFSNEHNNTQRRSRSNTF